MQLLREAHSLSLDFREMFQSLLLLEKLTAGQEYLRECLGSAVQCAEYPSPAQ